MSESAAARVVVFGATGQLGVELIASLDEGAWPVAEVVGVVSESSPAAEVEFGGDLIDLETKPPALKGRDLIFICTPRAVALEVVREALRAEVACVDCSGALTGQAEVPMPIELASKSSDSDAAWQAAPLLSLASSTTLAWAPILVPLQAAVGIERVDATVLSSAGAHGRSGIEALSEETVALFNQTDTPQDGPAGQPVAFDVIPGGGIEAERVRHELARALGAEVALDLAGLQVPAFVGEGASISIETSKPLTRSEFESLLGGLSGVDFVRDGAGSRGLVAVDSPGSDPIGPTLRDAAGRSDVLVGRLTEDPSRPEGRGWRLWVCTDPLRRAAGHAARLGGRRLGLA